MKRFETRSEGETILLGVEVACMLKPGDVIALVGDLGSGKTRFVQGVCKGLGVQEHVASPTFTILNEYHVNSLNIYHFDFYRVRSVREIIEIGFEEYINSDGICLIEWADKAQELLPPQRYDVHMSLGADECSRLIIIEEIAEVSA